MHPNSVALSWFPGTYFASSSTPALVVALGPLRQPTMMDNETGGITFWPHTFPQTRSDGLAYLEARFITARRFHRTQMLTGSPRGAAQRGRGGLTDTRDNKIQRHILSLSRAGRSVERRLPLPPGTPPLRVCSCVQPWPNALPALLTAPGRRPRPDLAGDQLPRPPRRLHPLLSAACQRRGFSPARRPSRRGRSSSLSMATKRAGRAGWSLLSGRVELQGKCRSREQIGRGSGKSRTAYGMLDR